MSLTVLVGSALAAVTVAAPPAAAATTTLDLNVGGGTPTGIDGQDFYPGIVTIHTGDSLNWHFRGAHTVNFYTPPGDPEAPGTGDGTFTGTNDPESSGIKTPAPPDNSYTLTFTNEGNFIYFCALHPGMQGVVQVLNSATVTDQAAATAAGSNTAGSQFQQDIASGQSAVNAFTPTTLAGPNGTVQHNIADGIGDNETGAADIEPPATPGPSGTGAVSLVFPGGVPTLHVVVTMTGMQPNTTSLNHIHTGQCQAPSPPTNNIIVPLTDLHVDGNGNATGTTDKAWDVNTMGPPALPANTWYINVHDPATPANSISCGNVVVHPASSLRFTPSRLVINAGDSVNWTQMDPREVHPIFIGPANLEPADPFAPPGGGTTATSPNAALNSGPMLPGNQYKVTFAAPGVYNYFCTLHDVVGMIGQVVVQPTGYRTMSSDGGVFTFGSASFNGSHGNAPLNAPIVGSANTPTDQGYWMTGTDGGIFTFGDAGFFGSTGSMKLNKPIVGMVPTPSGKGYWLVAADGGVFTFGDAKFFGSTGSIALNKPIVGIAAAPDGSGYWLVASDGGIFNFGSAKFFGSTGNVKLNKPVVGMAAAPDGTGYWLVATDGGIFTFGSAAFFGSTGATKLNKPIVNILGSPDAAGYWLVASDGGIFTFGSAKFFGSTGGTKQNAPTVAITM